MARRPEGGSVIMRSRAAVTGTQIVGEDGPSLPVTAWSHNESQQLATVGTTTARVNRLTQTFSWSKLKCFTVTHGPSMDPGVEEATQILSWSRHTQSHYTMQSISILFLIWAGRELIAGWRGQRGAHEAHSCVFSFVCGKTTERVCGCSNYLMA